MSAVFALSAGLALRLWFYSRIFEVSGDSLVYGGIAKNLMQHGRYALTLASGASFPTLIRLPGYPGFLVACFGVFGMENYAAAAWVQITLGLLTCILLADFARRIVPAGRSAAAAQAALWLAALCPFTAVYEANPLTEGPTLFCIALALWAVVRLLGRPGWRFAIAFTFAVTWAALLRPDGALVGLVLAPALWIGLRRQGAWNARTRRMALACVALALLPFVLWTVRNARVFHVFQPLAPESATDPGDPVYPGWEGWVKTWSLDFATTYTVYWNVPDDELSIDALPERAFDSAEQRARTAALIGEYNGNGYKLTPELDAGFAALAHERRAAHRMRSYVALPLGRVADMWLRPRVENLPI
ncbi:MAG TPA: glycosyltransferase family 39 protein, partial [Terracidiphilus sp.]